MILVEAKGLFIEKGDLLQETLIAEVVLILYKFTFKCGKGKLSVEVLLKRGFPRIKKTKLTSSDFVFTPGMKSVVLLQGKSDLAVSGMEA